MEFQVVSLNDLLEIYDEKYVLESILYRFRSIPNQKTNEVNDVEYFGSLSNERDREIFPKMC